LGRRSIEKTSGGKTRRGELGKRALRRGEDEKRSTEKRKM